MAMTLILDNRDVSAITYDLTLEKSVDTASDVLKAKIIFEGNDGYLPNAFGEVSDNVWLYDQDVLIFEGKVIKSEVFGKDGYFSILAMDLGHFLGKNDIYGNFGSDSRQNVIEILGQCNIPFGSAEMVYCQPFSTFGTLSALDLINQMYGSGYCIKAKNGKLHIVKNGTTIYTLRLDNIVQIQTYKDTKDMVNSVKLVSNKNYIVHTMDNPKAIEKYGIHRRYYFSKNITDYSGFAKAKEILPLQRASITLLNQSGIDVGDLVNANFPRYGLEGSFTVTDMTYQLIDGISLVTLQIEREEI